jgi:hypothetical protein
MHLRGLAPGIPAYPIIDSKNRDARELLSPDLRRESAKLDGFRSPATFLDRNRPVMLSRVNIDPTIFDSSWADFS